MTKKYPNLGESLGNKVAKQKNELLILSKSLQIAQIIVHTSPDLTLVGLEREIPEDKQPQFLQFRLCNNPKKKIQNLRFLLTKPQISDKLSNFSMNTAKCKKIYNKHFKKRLDVDMNNAEKVRYSADGPRNRLEAFSSFILLCLIP